MTKHAVFTSLAIALAVLAAPALAGEAKGTVAYKGRTLDVKYAYLVTTKDAMSGKPMRRLILAPKDIGGKIDDIGIGDLGDQL